MRVRRPAEIQQPPVGSPRRSASAIIGSSGVMPMPPATNRDAGGVDEREVVPRPADRERRRRPPAARARARTRRGRRLLAQHGDPPAGRLRGVAAQRVLPRRAVRPSSQVDVRARARQAGSVARRRASGSSSTTSAVTGVPGDRHRRQIRRPAAVAGARRDGAHGGRGVGVPGERQRRPCRAPPPTGAYCGSLDRHGRAAGPGSRSCRTPSSTRSSSRASGAPRQACTPWPKPRCGRSKRAVEVEVVGGGEHGRVAARARRRRGRPRRPARSGAPPSTVSRVTRRCMPVIADSKRSSSSSAAARLASSRCAASYGAVVGRAGAPGRCRSGWTTSRARRA